MQLQIRCCQAATNTFLLGSSLSLLFCSRSRTGQAKIRSFMYFSVALNEARFCSSSAAVFNPMLQLRSCRAPEQTGLNDVLPAYRQRRGCNPFFSGIYHLSALKPCCPGWYIPSEPHPKCTSNRNVGISRKQGGVMGSLL